MPKLLIMGPVHPLRGGLATFNERLAREFQAMGWEVVLFSFSLQYPGFLFPGKTQFSDEPAPEQLKIRTLINSVNPFNWIITGRKARKENADLIIWCFWLPFMGPCLGSIARVIGKRRTKHIGLLHNVIPHEKRPGDRMFSQWFLSAMDGFVAMSDAVMQDLMQFDSQKPRKMTLHPLYDNFGEAISRETAIQRLGLDPQFRYLLFFGFIREYKGLDLLLEAFSAPEMREIPIRLIIAGEFYQDAKPYLDQITRLGIRDFLILRNDFIPTHAVRDFFCAADLVVQPYKTATQSGVTQIAYHFNIPMVVTNVSGLPENVPDGVSGYVVEPNPDAVKKGILDYFRQNKMPEFKSGMEQEKRKYSWQKMADSFLETAGIKLTHNGKNILS